VRTWTGLFLTFASVPGFEWGARVSANVDSVIGALVLAYGLGLCPLAVGMLLMEADHAVEKRPAVLAAILPGMYIVLRWGTIAKELHVIHDKAFVPAILLVTGAVVAIGWTVSLWIRLSRKATAGQLESMKTMTVEEIVAAEKAAKTAENSVSETENTGKKDENT